MNRSEIGERIKMARENAGMTQYDVGIAIGQNEESAQKRVSLLERGTARLSTDELITMSKLYCVSTDYLLGIIDHPQSKTEITISDIFQHLFELEKVGITLSLEQKNDIVPSPIDGEPYMETFEDIALHFDKISVINKMKEWKKIKDVCENKNEDIYKNLYESWQKGILSDTELIWSRTCNNEIPF